MEDIDPYTYSVAWSPEDQEYVATCVEFPSISWLDGDAAEAIRGVQKLVFGNAEDRKEFEALRKVVMAQTSASRAYLAKHGD